MPLRTKTKLIHDFATLTLIEELTIRNLREFLASGSTSIAALELCKDLRELQMKRRYLLAQLQQLDASRAPGEAMIAPRPV